MQTLLYLLILGKFIRLSLKTIKQAMHRIVGFFEREHCCIVSIKYRFFASLLKIKLSNKYNTHCG